MKIMKPTPDDYQKLAWSCVKRADYSGAMRIAKRCLKDWPSDFLAEKLYASILGDYAEQSSGAKRRALKKESARRLRALTLRLRGKNEEISGSIRNEYYYQSENFRAQYALGEEEVKRGVQVGYYSQGVGAAWHAKKLLDKGLVSRARRWALRSKQAWVKYTRFCPNYYNSYVHFALAVGILGSIQEAEKLLAKAARLSRQPRDFREFKEIRAILAKYKNTLT